MNVFFFSSRRRHTRCSRDWSSDVCSSDLPHHVVEAPAPTLLVEEAHPAQVSDVPAERHQYVPSLRRPLWLEEERPRRVVEDRRVLTELVLQKRAETPSGADEPTECRPVWIVAPDSQPWAFVSPDELGVDQKSLHQVEQGVLLKVAGGVVGGVEDRESELLGRDAERAEDVLGHIRRKRLAAGALDHPAEEPVPHVRVGVL